MTKRTGILFIATYALILLAAVFSGLVNGQGTVVDQYVSGKPIENVKCAVSDGTHVYLGSESDPARVIKLRLSDLQRTATLDIAASERLAYLCPALYRAQSAELLMAGFDSANPRLASVIWIDAARMTVRGSLKFLLPARPQNSRFVSAFLDASQSNAFFHYSFFVEGRARNILYRVDVSSMSPAGNLEFGEGFYNPLFLSVDPAQNVALFSTSSNITRIYLGDLSLQGQAPANNRHFVLAEAADAAHVYYSNGPIVARVSLTDPNAAPSFIRLESSDDYAVVWMQLMDSVLHVHTRYSPARQSVDYTRHPHRYFHIDVSASSTANALWSSSSTPAASTATLPYVTLNGAAAQNVLLMKALSGNAMVLAYSDDRFAPVTLEKIEPQRPADANSVRVQLESGTEVLEDMFIDGSGAPIGITPLGIAKFRENSPPLYVEYAAGSDGSRNRYGGAFAKTADGQFVYVALRRTDAAYTSNLGSSFARYRTADLTLDMSGISSPAIEARNFIVGTQLASDGSVHFLAEKADGNIVRYDVTHSRVVASVPLTYQRGVETSAIYNAVADSRGQFAYISVVQQNVVRILRFNFATNTIDAELSLPDVSYVSSMMLDRFDRFLFVATSGDTIFRVIANEPGMRVASSHSKSALGFSATAPVQCMLADGSNSLALLAGQTTVVAATLDSLELRQRWTLQRAQSAAGAFNAQTATAYFGGATFFLHNSPSPANVARIYIGSPDPASSPTPSLPPSPLPSSSPFTPPSPSPSPSLPPSPPPAPSPSPSPSPIPPSSPTPTPPEQGSVRCGSGFCGGPLSSCCADSICYNPETHRCVAPTPTTSTTPSPPPQPTPPTPPTPWWSPSPSPSPAPPAPSPSTAPPPPPPPSPSPTAPAPSPSPSSGGSGPTVSCSPGDRPCGSRCYSPSTHTCIDNQHLCGLGEGICGVTCYDQSRYTCCNDNTSLCPR